MRETLVLLDRSPPRHAETVGHTHDEIVMEAVDDAGWVSDVRRHLEDAMLYRPDWRKTLPLAVEIEDNFYYTKAPAEYR